MFYDYLKGQINFKFAFHNIPKALKFGILKSQKK